MKTLIATIVLGVSLIGLEFVALDTIVNDLRHEISVSTPTLVPFSETVKQAFSEKATGYKLTTQHLQPAYNTLDRTDSTQDLQ